jgi:putative Ca2+/H+ antiporter (TMEM165/GDT1 family)
MNLGLALSVFGVLFLAELPDKTMIATLIMGSRGRALAVWLGASLAFTVHMAIAAVAGGLLNKLPHLALEVVVTVMFFAFAAYLLLVPEKEAIEEGEEEASGERATTSLRTFLSAFTVILVAETGDLTQILAASFTAKSHEPITVFFASTLALVAVAAIGAFGGKALLKVLPLARIRQLGGILLLILGVVGIVQMLTS